MKLTPIPKNIVLEVFLHESFKKRTDIKEDICDLYLGLLEETGYTSNKFVTIWAIAKDTISNKVVGYLTLDWSEVRTLFVSKEYRNQGIGNALLSEVILNRDHSWNAFYVTIPGGCDLKAETFFKEFGFEEAPGNIPERYTFNVNRARIQKAKELLRSCNHIVWDSISPGEEPEVILDGRFNKEMLKALLLLIDERKLPNEDELVLGLPHEDWE